MTESRRRSTQPLWRGAAVVLAVATLSTLFLAAPILRAPSQRLFGSEIVGRHHDPYTMARRFEHLRRPLPYDQPLTDYPGALLARLFGSGVAAYNALVLASFPLAALFAYLLIRRLGGSELASVIGGLLYAFSPFHLAHAAYHPHVSQIQWLPLYLLALWLCLERASPRRLLLLAAATALTVLADYYAGLIAAILTPVALAGFWWSRPRPSRLPLQRTALALLIVAALGLLYAFVHARGVLENPSLFVFDRTQPLRYGALPSSYLLPPVEHPVLGGWSGELWATRAPGDALLEQQVTVGFGLLALAGAALLSGGGRRSAALALAAIALTAFVFSLKPQVSLGGVELPAPSGLVHALLPVFRAFARFGVAVFLALAALAALGFDRLRSSPSPAARWAAPALVALALFELAPWPPWRWRDVLPTPAHRWLAEQPGPLRVLDCVALAGPAQTVTRAFFPHELGVRVEEECWPRTIGGWLAARGYSHLVVRNNTHVLERWPRIPAGLEPAGDFGGARVFVVTGPPTELSVEVARGFYRAEIKGARSYRWTQGGRAGSLLLFNSGERPVAGTLELELHAFPEERRVVVHLGGRPLPRLRVGTEPTVYALGPLQVPPGQHLLELFPVEPPVVADSVLGNGDPRPLSLALWGWSWNAGELESDAAPGR